VLMGELRLFEKFLEDQSFFLSNSVFLRVFSDFMNFC
jgi:hypothetical protein